MRCQYCSERTTNSSPVYRGSATNRPCSRGSRQRETPRSGKQNGQTFTKDNTGHWNRTAILSTKSAFCSPSSLLNLRGTLRQPSCKAYRPTLAATLIVFKVVNSWRTQRTLKPLRLLLFVTDTLPLLKFRWYALEESFCVDDQ